MVRNHPVYMGRQMVRPGHRPLTIKAQDFDQPCLGHSFFAIFDCFRQAETRELDSKMLSNMLFPSKYAKKPAALALALDVKMTCVSHSPHFLPLRI